MSGHPRPIPSTRKKSKAASAAPSEADIQRSIIQLLKLAGAVVLRTNSGHIVLEDRHIQMGEAGTSDITACHQGRFVAIEVKKPGNKPTAKQQAYLDRVTEAGGLAFVAWSVEDVQRELGL